MAEVNQTTTVDLWEKIVEYLEKKLRYNEFEVNVIFMYQDLTQREGIGATQQLFNEELRKMVREKRIIVRSLNNNMSISTISLVTDEMNIG